MSLNCMCFVQGPFDTGTLAGDWQRGERNIPIAARAGFCLGTALAAVAAADVAGAAEEAAGVVVGSDIVVVDSYRVRRGGVGKLFSEVRRGSEVA